MARSTERFEFEPAPPVLLRTILRHLRLNGWSTRAELRQVAGIAECTLQAILRDDLQLRVRQRKTPTCGRGPDEFNLPIIDRRGRWIYAGNDHRP